jgi:GNAT superfamily N-acetyltransferase
VTPDPDSLIIRDAVPTDIDIIVEFNARLASESEGKTLDRAVLTLGVARALEEPDRLRYWIAEPPGGGPAIGQAAVTREWSDWRNGWLWWFQSVYVHQDHRRRGVFRALHAHIRGLALASTDVIGLRLYVESENVRAHRTYESLGLLPGGYHVCEEIWPDRFNRQPG